MQTNRVWIAFAALALFWGTSFLFIKIALRTLDPVTLVGLRLLIGWVGLTAILLWRRERLPRFGWVWRHFALLGAINTAIPFLLFTWAESGANGIDSGVASIINSAVPLFTIVIGGFILHTEPVDSGRLIGLAVGFGGVVLLFSRDLTPTALEGRSGTLIKMVGALGASLCYALSSLYARRYVRHVPPLQLALATLVVADALVWSAALSGPVLPGGSPLQISLPAATVISLLWLGLLGSCIAYLLYFYILAEWGATRTTLVTYVIPVVGVTAGVIFLGEPLDWRLIGGGVLILSGVGFVNWRPRRTMAQSRSGD